MFVDEVTEGAPAEKAGIKRGDFIVKFNGMEVKTMESLQEKLALCKAGKKVEVVVKRADNGEYVEKTVEVTLGKKADAESSATAPSTDNNNSNNGIPYGNGNSFRRNSGNFLQ